jgi:hypothetical protein
MKKVKIAYWISTGLLTVLMLFSAGMYLFNYEEVKVVFTHLGYPDYIVYPLAIAKLLGLVAIWTNKSKWLKEWAYAGFFFDLVLALFAHHMVNEEIFPALLGIIFVMVSYFTSKKISAVD